MDINGTILEFIKNLDINGIKDIPEERLLEIKVVADGYRSNIYDLLDRIPMRAVFYNTIAKICNHKNLSIFLGETEIPFNNYSEVLVFIIYSLDPNYKMREKYTAFLEETNSKTTAIYYQEQYAKEYSAFFERKILFGELSLQAREIANKPTKRKRTIIE